VKQFLKYALKMNEPVEKSAFLPVLLQDKH